MDGENNKSLLQEVTHLKEIVQQLNTGLGLDSETLGKSHPYGDLNLAEKKQDMLNTFQRIATLVSEYKKWSEENKASEKTTLQKVKELQEQQATSDKLQSILNNCQLAGTRYLEESNRLPVVQGTTYKRIQMIAKNLEKSGITFLGNENMPEDPVHLFCGISVVVALDLETGTAVSLDFDVGDGDKEEILSQQLLEKLQTFHFLDFEKLFARYYHVDTLNALYNDKIPVKTVMTTIEDDLKKIHEHELNFFPREECLAERTGVISKQCSGYWVSFAVKKIPSKIEIPASTDPLVVALSDTPDVNTYSALIRLEQARNSVTLPLVTSISHLDDDGGQLQSSPENNTESVSLNFMLLFEPTIVISITVLYEIFSITGLHKQMPNTKLRLTNTTDTPTAGVPIPSLLLGSVLSSFPQFVNGKEHRYTNNSHGYGAVRVKRIPFANVQQLVPILQILREQITFNELLTSCFLEQRKKDPNFSKKRKYGYEEEEEKVTLDVEINFICPGTIDLRFTSEGTLFALNIKIMKNGKIECHITSGSADAHQKFDVKALAQELEKTHDIPLTLEKFWGNGVETMVLG